MKYLLERYCLNFSNSAKYIKLAAVLLISLFSMNVHAQQVSARVLNGWGKTIKTNGHTYDGSVGESGVITLKAGGYTITQGFLQPIDLKIPCGNVELKAFPNPVVSGMRIYADGCDVKIANVQAYDLFGKLVYEGVPFENEVDFSRIGVGVYMIRAMDTHNNILGVVKVIKTTI